MITTEPSPPTEREDRQLPVLEMTRPMTGFAEHTSYLLVRLDEDGVLCALRSLDDPQLRFLVVPAARFFPDFAPLIPDEVAGELGIEAGSGSDAADATDVVVLLVLTAGESLASTTANLLAPVVVNTRTLRAAQVLLDDPGLSIRTPLVA